MIGVTMKFKIVCCWMSILMVLLVVSVAEEEERQYRDEIFKELEEIGIDSDDLRGCAQQCSYDTGTNTLHLVSGAALSNVPSGMTVVLNGGRVDISGASISGEGKFMGGNPPILEGGEASLSSHIQSASFQFRDASITADDLKMRGSGKVVNGVIILDQAIIEKNAEEYPVQNVKVQLDSRNGEKYVAGQDFKWGTSTDFMTLESGRAFHIVGGEFSTLEGVPDIIIDPLPGKGRTMPHITLNGNPTATLSLSDRFPKSSGFILHVDGNDHTFYAEQGIIMEGGSISFPAGSLTHPSNEPQLQMVDGVYVGTRKEPVHLYFDEKTRLGENYIAMGEKHLRMGGWDFKVALSEEREGFGSLSATFPFKPVSSKYARSNHEGYAPFRLLFDFNGGEEGEGSVFVNPEAEHIWVKGTLNVINGPNKLHYYEDYEGAGEQHYDFQYVGCGSRQQSACAELGYTVQDGGMVDVVREVNTETLTRGNDPVDFLMGGDEGKETTLELAKDGVYVLAYKGGGFSSEFLGEGKEKFGWGHVGMLYYKGGEWWVAEATGARTAIRPLDHSLFNAGVDGVWKVVDDEGVAVTSESSIRMAEEMAGAKYDYNPLTTKSLSCVEVVCTALDASVEGGFDTSRVSLQDVPASDRSLLAGTYAHLNQMSFGALSSTVARIPRAVVQSSNLEVLAVSESPDTEKQKKSDDSPI
jgi:hypothetical protein